MNSRTRSRTSDGDCAPARAWLRIPLCLAQWVRLRVTGRRPELPWIPYPAIRALARALPPEARALEIGAGMSTLWLAPRCASLLSIEADENWYIQIDAMLTERQHRHVRLEHRWERRHMCDFSAIPEGSLDLVFVDGGPRLDCARAGLPMLKAGGLLYVDNTDDASAPESTKRFLRETASALGATLDFFRGLPPASLFVNEGGLLRIPSPGSGPRQVPG